MDGRQNPIFETLESRTMMSVAPIAVHKPVVKKPAAKKAVVVKTIDPATTEKSITYQSFALDPLFSSAGPTMADINQGDLGDCYLLSTFATVAKTDPSLIKKDIVADGNGLYTVTFGSGKGTAVTVNADLPVFADGELAYAKLGQQNSLWVPLMEKAYVIYADAKAPSYNAINGGWMSSAFSALGLKSQGFTSATNAATLATTLQVDLRENEMVTFGTQSTLPSSSALIAGHAYQVLSVSGQGNDQTITLRNPWGNAASDDGIITVGAAELFKAFAGVVTARA